MTPKFETHPAHLEDGSNAAAHRRALAEGHQPCLSCHQRQLGNVVESRQIKQNFMWWRLIARMRAVMSKRFAAILGVSWPHPSPTTNAVQFGGTQYAKDKIVNNKSRSHEPTRRASTRLGLAAAALAMTLVAPAQAQTSAPGLTNGVIFTADEYGSTISQIDLRSGTVTTFPATIEPHNIQISPDGSVLLAVGNTSESAMGSGAESTGHGMTGMDVAGELVLFDPRDLAAGPVERIAVGMHPAHVITDLAGTRAFVTNAEDDTLSVIDLASRKVTATVATGDYPHGQRLSPDGREIMVANVQSGTVSIIDAKTLTELASIPVGITPVQVGFTPDGGFLYASLRDANQVAVVDVKTRTLIATVDVGRNPIQVFVTPDGRFVYVANQGTETNPDNTVSVIEVATNEVVATIPTGRGAHGVVVSHDGATVFVTNILDATVAAIDVATQTVIATIPVGKGPNGITYLP